MANGNEGLSVILARGGVRTELVPAPSWNIKVTTPDDWVVAQALCGQAAETSGPLSAASSGPAKPAQSP